MVISKLQIALIAIVLITLSSGVCGFRQLRIHRHALQYAAQRTHHDNNLDIVTSPTSLSMSSLKSLRLVVATSLVGLLALQGTALAKDNEGTKTDKKFGE